MSSLLQGRGVVFQSLVFLDNGKRVLRIETLLSSEDFQPDISRQKKNKHPLLGVRQPAPVSGKIGRSRNSRTPLVRTQRPLRHTKVCLLHDVIRWVSGVVRWMCVSGLRSLQCSRKHVQSPCFREGGASKGCRVDATPHCGARVFNKSQRRCKHLLRASVTTSWREPTRVLRLDHTAHNQGLRWVLSAANYAPRRSSRIAPEGGRFMWDQGAWGGSRVSWMKQHGVFISLTARGNCNQARLRAREDRAL